MAHKQQTGTKTAFAIFGKSRPQREKEAAERLKDMKKDAATGIMSAAEKGDTRKVAYWLANGADANEKDALSVYATPLMNAAANGHFEICKLLLEKGAKPNTKDDLFGLDALTLAAKKGDARICLLLIQKGARPVINEKAWGEIPAVSQQFMEKNPISQKQLDALVSASKRMN